MADISQGNHANLILAPGDVYRIVTGGVATVLAVYGAPEGTTTVTAASQAFGPYDAPAKLKVTATSGSCSYAVDQVDALGANRAIGQLTQQSMAALAASGINVQLRNSPYLSKGNMCGRLTTKAIAADHTSQHAFTFETAPGYLRVLVGNNLGAALTSIKVSYAALPTAASTDNLANAAITGVINGLVLTPTPQVSSADMVGRQVNGTGVTASTYIKSANADGTYTVNQSQTVASTTLTLAVGWVSLTLAGSSTWASVSAGSATHTVDNPNYTASDWAYEVVTNPISIDRQDGGTLPIGVVRIEVPQASNPNIPVSYWATTTAFEAEGDANTAPWGRFYRCRTQSVLGVTNKALFTSTTMDGQVIPIIIQYVPRDMAAGASVLVVGNSIDEGVNSGATARRPSWMAETQARVSTPKKPLEIVNAAIHGAASSRYADRVTTMAPLLKTEIVSLPWYNINSATVDGSANQAAIDVAGMLGQFNIARVVLDAYNQTFVIPTGLPSNYAARHVVEQDKLRIARNAKMMALPDSPRIKKLDIATPFSGSLDVNGQTTIVSGGSSDGLHDSDAGRALLASPAVTLYSSILRGAV